MFLRLFTVVLAILDITPCTEYTCHCCMTDPSGSYILCDLCWMRYKHTTTLQGAELEKRVRLVAKLRKECSDLVGPTPHTGMILCSLHLSLIFLASIFSI